MLRRLVPVIFMEILQASQWNYSRSSLSETGAGEKCNDAAIGSRHAARRLKLQIRAVKPLEFSSCWWRICTMHFFLFFFFFEKIMLPMRVLDKSSPWYFLQLFVWWWKLEKNCVVDFSGVNNTPDYVRQARAKIMESPQTFSPGWRIGRSSILTTLSFLYLNQWKCTDFWRGLVLWQESIKFRNSGEDEIW